MSPSWNFSQFMKEMKNWDFGIALSFIFCQIVILSGMCKRGEPLYNEIPSFPVKK